MNLPRPLVPSTPSQRSNTMEGLNTIKDFIPDYAKDVRLNLDNVIGRSALAPNEAVGCALAAAFATGNKTLADLLTDLGALEPVEVDAAKTAGALMGMTNIWYHYLDVAGDADLAGQQAGLRMQAYVSHGGVDERRFELWTLAASIIGRCKNCIQAHVDSLKKQGASTGDLREVGRIAAVVNAAANVLASEGRR